MRETYIAGAVRTPLGKGRPGGALAPVHPVDLLAHTLRALLRRTGVDAAQVDDVIVGCVSPTDVQGSNIARLALLNAGFPFETPGVTIDRMCGSSQQAIHFASQAVQSGDMDIVVAAGIEMMSQLPMGTTWGVLTEDFLADFPYDLASMGISAERVAEKYGLSRRALDECAAESHNRAARAQANGWFASQIVPVEVRTGASAVIVDSDEGIRPNPDLDKMLALKPAFKKDGLVTAANASQVSDGAAAVLVCSKAKAEELGLRNCYRIVARDAVGSDPELTLTGPIPATRRVLRKADLAIGDMDVIEANEAFACVVLAWAQELSPPMDRVNPNGGAIALGHPLGATGAVLMTKLVHELERRQGRYGLQTMCIGHGMGVATIIERLEQ